MIVMEYKKAKKLQRRYDILRVVLLCVMIIILYFMLKKKSVYYKQYRKKFCF